MRHSSVHYTTLNDQFNLYPKSVGEDMAAPSVYLIEINVRTPGIHVATAVYQAYGVDYNVQQLLAPIGDEAWFKALAIPFRGGPQWTCVLPLIPEERPGIMASEDAGKELLERVPELRACVPDYRTVKKRGDALAGPAASTLSYLAYFSVTSRRGRKDALRLTDKLSAEFCYELM